MNDVNLPGLVVDIEARIDKLEKGIIKANAAHKRGSTDLENRARQSAKRMEETYAKSGDKIAGSFERMFSGFARSGAIVAGVGATVLALKEVAASVAEVDREARKASVSTRVWQEWTFVAAATGMSIDGVTDALKEMNIRGAEFALTGKGSAADAFARLGYSADEVAEKLKDPNRFLDDMIGRLQKLSAAEQALNLDELFGGTGAEQLAKVLGLSVTEIQKLRGEAQTFTDEQIEAAKKVDAEWGKMWRNFSVMAKSAAINGATVAKAIIDTIHGPKSEGDMMRDLGAMYQNQRLTALKAERDALAKQIADVEATPVSRILGQRGIDQRNEVLADMRKDLAGLDTAIADVTKEGEDLDRKLKGLDDTSKKVAASFVDNVAKASNFKKALTDLKNLVPELKAELDKLAESSAMETAYQKAARSAGSWGELMQATNIAGRANSISSFGQHDNILDLIGAAEGTDKGRGYNETLDYGRWTGGAVDLTSKTLNEILALQKQMLADPANRAMYQDKAGNNVGSSALGRYQITSTTLKDMMAQLGLAGDRKFDADTQDEIARALLRRRGDDVAGLRNEWEGLRRVDDSTIRNAYNGTATGRTTLDPSDGQKAATDLAKQQDAARKSLNQTVQEGLDLARFEQSISGMTASQQKIELQLYQAQAEAKRSGIVLSDAEFAKMREKISLTQQLDQKNQAVASSSEGLQNAQKFFAEGFTSSLSGLLTGAQTLQGALQGLLNSLVDAALQAALLGKGPLAGLFGGATGGSGILGAIFGFSEGGFTGKGGKMEPAGIVHRGEYVMSAKSVSRLGAKNLEMLHAGSLKGFASGGYVGSAAAIRHPDLKGGSVNATQAITITAPITVNGSAGTPEQNTDLAGKMRKEMEGTMRGLIVSELIRQRRPGNMLS